MLKRVGGVVASLSVLGVVLLGLLYWAWPTIVSPLVARALTQAGLLHVVVEVGRPTLTSVPLPLLTFQTAVGSEQMIVTVEDAQLDYTLASLRAGWIEAIRIAQASVVLTPTPLASAPMARARPQAGVERSLDGWLAPWPVVPIREVQLGVVSVRREGVEGTLHEGTLRGQLRLDGGRVTATFEVHPQGSEVYGIALQGAHVGDLALSLTSQLRRVPIMTIESKMWDSGATWAMSGTLRADLGELVPVLALVMPIEGDVRHAQGRVSVDWSGQSDRIVPIERWWEDEGTRIDGTLHLAADLPQWGAIASALAVNGVARLHWKGGRLEWEMEPGVRIQARIPPARLSVPAWLVSRGDENPFLTAESLAPVFGEVDRVLSPTEFTVRGPIQIQYGHQSDPAWMILSLTECRWAKKGGWTGTAKAHVVGRGRPPAPPSVQMAAARWDLSGSVTLEPDRLTVVLQPGTSLSVSSLHLASVTVPAGSLRVSKPVVWTTALAEERMRVGPGEITLRVPTVSLPSMTVGLESALVSIRHIETGAPAWSAIGDLRLEGLVPIGRAPTWPATSWVAGVRVGRGVAAVDAQGFTRDRWVGIRATATHHLQSEEGHGRIVLAPVSFDAQGRTLSLLLTPWTYPVDATGGSLAATADMTWGRGVREAGNAVALRAGTLRVDFDRVAGQAKGFPFTGLTTSVSVTVDEGARLSMPEPTQISAETLHTGVEFRQLAARVQVGWENGVQPSWAELRRLSVDVLGGRMTSEGGRFELARPRQTVAVELQGLQLQEILNLEQQKGLDGTGVLDGRLPLTLGEAGATVRNGVVEARVPGGVIRYRPDTGAVDALVASDSQLNMVLQPLSNFHYNALKAGVQYQADGTLDLAMTIEGRNPDWQRGRPVHFNLTVQENIPALMRSLGVVKGIQQSIERQFDRRTGR